MGHADESNSNYEAKIHELEQQLKPHSYHPQRQESGPAFQGMIDSALSVANSRLASLKKAHTQLLGKYTELEIRFIELQAQQELDNLPMNHGTQKGHRSMPQRGYAETHGAHGESDGERGHYQSQRGHTYHSEGSLSPHSASFSESTNSNYSGVGQGMHFPSPVQSQSAPPSATTNPQSPGYMSPSSHSAGNGKFSGGYLNSPVESSQQPNYSHHSQDFPNPPLSRHVPSMVDSTLSSGDSQSMRTVTSTTSSEKRRETIKPQSEVRVRGRGS